MLSQTRRALEDFDNQHDFERMAADVLNALGYSDVEPMAPGGGADGSRDIRFRDGDTPGICFVTLEKRVNGKYKRDLSKQPDAEGVIALFCNVHVTPSTKLAFAKEAMAKGYGLLVFDLERLRSLLDASLKEIRRRYLHIDDEAAARLRSEVRKLLKFADAMPDDSGPPTMLERRLADNRPRRLFELLLRYEEGDVAEVPGIGAALRDHLTTYYRFRQAASRLEKDLRSRIASTVGDCFNSQAVWQMYFQYALPRLLGQSMEAIIAGGNFLNCGVTWESTESVFTALSGEEALTGQVLELNRLFDAMTQCLGRIMATEGVA
jgi:hypothetical protein